MFVDSKLINICRSNQYFWFEKNHYTRLCLFVGRLHTRLNRLISWKFYYECVEKIEIDWLNTMPLTLLKDISIKHNMQDVSFLIYSFRWKQYSIITSNKQIATNIYNRQHCTCSDWTTFKQLSSDSQRISFRKKKKMWKHLAAVS